MKTNTQPQKICTHEGAVAKHINPELQLRRSVMSCLLWETEFYEDGETIAKRIADLVPQVKPDVVAGIAIQARGPMKLRHVPLLLVREMARHKTHRSPVGVALAIVIQRPDELAEFLSIYWRDGRCPLSSQVKKGLAAAFVKFNPYELAKYNRDDAIKLRDVLFLCHAKPKDAAQAKVFKDLVDGKLATPDTWEVALSGGADKKEAFTRLVGEKKLGALALLRNLRNMKESGVEREVVKNAIANMKTERVLPFRFISAARHASDLEPYLEEAMFKCLANVERLTGKTVLLVDVSGSMGAKLSMKSEMTRMDAAAGLAVLLREICDDVAIMTFSDRLKAVPLRRGFALRDAIESSQPHSGTELLAALYILSQTGRGSAGYDRVIVITDEQAHYDAMLGGIPDPGKKGYMINVASARNGVGYGAWRHIDGFSEAVVTYITEVEKYDSQASIETTQSV